MSGVKKRGVFGGSFNPPHKGHLNLVKSVTDKFGLDFLHIIPTFKTPLRDRLEMPPAHLRLDMLAQVFGNDTRWVIDDREIQRGGVSYTFETLQSMQHEFPLDEIYLIVGLDQFEIFERWRNYEDILFKYHMIVVSRPHHELPTTAADLPAAIADIVASFNQHQCELISGRKLYFHALNDVDVSSTDVRRRLARNQDVSDLVPNQLIPLLVQSQVYTGFDKKIGDFEKFSVFAGQRLHEKGAKKVLAYDLRDLDKPCEFAVIGSGTNVRHTIAVAENLMDSIKKMYGVYPQGVEGLQEGRWVVMDYGSLIIHVFYDFVREEYQLEELWRAARQLALPLDAVLNDR